MSESGEPDPQTVEILARERGLQHIYDAYHADLIKALALVAKCRQALGEPLPVRTEPWPAMRPFDEQG